MVLVNGPSNDWFWDRIAEAVKAFLVGAYVVGAGIVWRIYQRGQQRDVRIRDLELRTYDLERYCHELRAGQGQMKGDLRSLKDDVKDISRNLNALSIALLRPPGH